MYSLPSVVAAEGYLYFQLLLFMLKESDYKQQMEHVLFASCLPSPKAIHHPSIDSVAMPLEIKLFIVTKKKVISASCT